LSELFTAVVDTQSYDGFCEQTSAFKVQALIGPFKVGEHI